MESAMEFNYMQEEYYITQLRKMQQQAEKCGDFLLFDCLEQAIEDQQNIDDLE